MRHIPHGKLAALQARVRPQYDLTPRSSASQPSERHAAEAAGFASLRTDVATTLLAQSREIGARWAEQVRTVALREAGAGDDLAQTAAGLVASLATALASDGSTADDLVVRGLSFGAEAFELGSSLHHALKSLDLLSAMLLYAVETSGIGGNAADGIRVSRRLQQATSHLTLSAAKGYTQAMGDSMRDRFRHLRHDLRNPLGTIKSVLAMMDDETMPAEARAHPRFRAMAKRNARALGELIADRLSDTAAVLPTLTHQRVSLRTVACGVRRTLRADAEGRGAAVVVGYSQGPVLVDAIALELLLLELLHSALQEAGPGDELHVDFGTLREGRVTVSLACAPSRPPVHDGEALDRLARLATRMRGELTLQGDTLVLFLPAGAAEPKAPRPDVPSTVSVAPDADAPASGGRDSGEASHDVGGPREREHGQSRS
jgi:signal transduction histidine kinase